MKRSEPPKRKKPLARGKPPNRGTKPLKRTRIKPISAKQRRSNRQLAKLVPEIRDRAGGLCQVRLSPNCRGIGEHPHHVVKRSARKGHRIEDCVWSCDPCNTHVEDHPVEAEAAGMVRRVR